MLLADLDRDYGLTASTIEPHPGGFESECWVVGDAWFVKVWRDGRRPQGLELLDRLHETGLPVIPAVRTRDGALHATTGARDYAVFPYAEGRIATLNDWATTADVMKHVHGTTSIDLPATTMDEPWLGELRARLDHPWISDRAYGVSGYADRLESVIANARGIEVPHVVCHRDLQGGNLLIDDDRVIAILDWDWARSAPREHDMWIAPDTGHTTEFLDRYGAQDLEPTHLEYALLARALRDMTSRVVEEVDRPGVDTWGFDRLERLEHDLESFRRYCA